MKVLFCLCLLIATGSAFHWLKKREVVEEDRGNGGPDCTGINRCLNLFKPISRILRRPSFNLLVTDGRLNLRCNSSELSKARDCREELDQSECQPVFTAGGQLAAWRHFCGNKTEVESLSDCWNVIDPRSAIHTCVNQNEGTDLGRTMPPCVGDAVALLPECGEMGGNLMTGLLSKMWAATMAQRPGQQH